MKQTIFFLTITLLVSFELKAQMVGGSGNSESPTKDIKAASIDEGGFSGDVSLFTGTYNSSYNLGTVSTPTGLSFSTTLSYSSTFSAGDNLPHSTGIPYGEGWNLDLPTISVSTEDYNKYSLVETQDILQGAAGADPTLIFYDYQNQNCDDALEEGKLYYYAPKLSIPGYASGRMVYKEKKGDDFVFVLHQFERYVEARLQPNATWLVVLEDGTQYHMDKRMLAHRNASNQRVQAQSDCIDNKDILENLLLPKTEIVSWYCKKITHPNKNGEIVFNYETHGCFDFFSAANEYQNQISNYFFGGNNNNGGGLDETCRDILLQSVEAKANQGGGLNIMSRLILDYEAVYDQIASDDPYRIPEESDPIYEPAGGADEMYAKISVYAQSSFNCEFNDWRRYIHWKSEDIGLDCTETLLPSKTNPYKGSAPQYLGLDNQYYLFNEVSCEFNKGASFKHGYLESPAIGLSLLPPSDIYQIETKILDDSREFLYDVNLAIGDDRFNFGLNGLTFFNTEAVEAKCYENRTGQSLFSTYNLGLKPFAYEFGSNFTNSLYFVMPSTPHKDFFFQIGPANSDILTDSDPSTLHCDQLYPNYPNDPNNEDPDLDPITSGAPIPNNFSVGYAWSMLKKFYEDFVGYDPCQNPTWWNGIAIPGDPCNVCQPGLWQNEPTPTRIVSTNNCAPSDAYLKNVEIFRYAKRPYMLKSAILQINNGSGISNVSNYAFRYEVKTVDLYGNIAYDIPNNENPEDFKKSLQLSAYNGANTELRKRNIFLLKEIRQLPADGEALSSQDFVTFFKYEETNNPEPFCTEEFVLGDFYVMTEVQNAIGKKTVIKYFEIDPELKLPGNWFINNVENSFAIESFDYLARPFSILNPIASAPCANFDFSLCDGTSIPGTTVRKKGSPYAYQIYMIVDQVTVDERNSATKSWDYDYQNGRITSEQTPFNANFQYDKQTSPKIGFQYTTVTGPHQGGNGPSTKYEHSILDKLTWGKLLSAETRDMDGKLMSSSTNTYEAVLAFESPVYRLNNVGPGYYSEYYNANGRPVISGIEVYQSYITAIKNWLSGGNQLLEHPDLDPATMLGTQYDLPKFYETRYDDLISQDDPSNSYYYGPYYLQSYFIKKTADTQKVYDKDENFIETTSEYQYFDAKYNGDIEAGQTGYAALGVDPKLIYEPSFQLYRVLTYSPHVGGGKDDAYTTQETFYWFDRKNEVDWEDHPHIDLVRDRNMRTLPFQVRTTTKAPGEAPIQRSSYIQHRSDWPNGSLLPSETRLQVEDGGVNYSNDLVERDANNNFFVYPYPTLKTNEILARNEFGQVTEERDVKKLRTTYNYNDVGLVTNITVGANLNFPLPTSYTYNDKNLVESSTEPNNLKHTYQYDDFLRLKETKRDVWPLQKVSYSKWDNNTSSSFDERALLNNVTITNYLNSQQSLSEVSYVDPLGRNLANTKGGITFDNNIFDIYGRPTIKMKPGGGIVINEGFPSPENAEFNFETAPRNNATKSSKFGLEIIGDEIMEYNNSIVDKVALIGEVNNSQASSYISEGKYWRQETKDEDGKIVVEFTNALGQLVATTSTDDGSMSGYYTVVKPGTVFKYESHGNVYQVSDPNGLQNIYSYNYLGKLYSKTTPDEGNTLYGYDMAGGLIVRKDGAGVHYGMYYDNFGRVKLQARMADGLAQWLGNNGDAWINVGGITYPYMQAMVSQSLDGNSVKEKEWFYNEYDASTENLMLDNYLNTIDNYGDYLGRAAQINNFDFTGKLVEMHCFSYNAAGHIIGEASQFSQYVITTGYKGICYSLSNVKPNFLGSPSQTRVNLNCNNTIDFTYKYRYDNWNNPTSTTIIYKGTEIYDLDLASYSYNHLTGGLAGKSFKDVGCEESVFGMSYSYDEQFRLSKMSSKIFEMNLFYDDFATNGNPKNYNGNINETVAEYKLHDNLDLDIVNPPLGDFQYPTFYRYTYDNLNRLTIADCELILNDLPTGALNPAQFGDAHYIFDLAGNILTEDRWFNYDQQSHLFEQEAYSFQYATGTNKLIGWSSQNTGSVFTYDGNGSMVSHTGNGISNIKYGRGSYPFILNNVEDYLYNASDERIYKGSEPAFYIRASDGRELGIYNLVTERMSWFVYGGDRAAKIEVDLCDPAENTGCEPPSPTCDAQTTQQQQTAMQNLNYITDPALLTFPTIMFRLKMCYGDDFYILREELPFIYGNVNILQQIYITDPSQTFQITQDTTTLLLDLADMLLYRAQNQADGYAINDYNPCVTLHCTSEGIPCSEEASAAQMSSINIPPVLTTPTRILRIRLCNMREIYIPLESLAYLQGSYVVLQQIEVVDQNETVNVSVNGMPAIPVPVSQITQYLGDTGQDIGMAGFQTCVDPCDESLPACAPGDFSNLNASITALEAQIQYYHDNPTLLPLPNNLIKIRMCNGREFYVFEQELAVVTSKVKILGSVPINGWNINLNVYNTNSQTWITVFTVEELLTQRGRGFELEGLFCDEDGNPLCLDDDIKDQQDAAVLLKAAMQGMTTEQVPLPNKLRNVKLCDETHIYVLDGETDGLPGDFTVESSVRINSTDQLFQVKVNGGFWETVDLNGLLGVRAEAIIMEATSESLMDGPQIVEFGDGDYPYKPEISYYVSDYLGNTRIVFNTSGKCGDRKYELEHVVDYFPYAKILREFKCSDAERFLSTQHERDKNTGFDYRGARFYDSEIGRFLSVDPLAADFAAWSTYNYVLGNPIRFLDPDGRAPQQMWPPPKWAMGLTLWLGNKVSRANQGASQMMRVAKSHTKSELNASFKAGIYIDQYLTEFGSFTPQNDITVLGSGYNLDGTKASGFDKTLAVAFVALPVSGGAVKNLAGEGVELLSKYVNKFSNQASHLDAKHINAAVGDILGNPITINGKTYDHLDEVETALGGLGKQLANLNKSIDTGSFSGEALDVAQNLRSRLQRQKDDISDVLRRAEIKTGN